MTAEELEELLAPRGNTALQQTVPPPINVASTGSIYRVPIVAATCSYMPTPGMYVDVDLGVSLNSGRDDYYGYQRDFTEGEKEMIRQSILDYINSAALGVRFDQRELQGLSRRVASHIESFLYRWFPYIRHPKIECFVSTSQYELAASFSITINELPIATVGVRTR